MKFLVLLVAAATGASGTLLKTLKKSANINDEIHVGEVHFRFKSLF